MSAHTEITPRLSVTELVAAYERAEQEIRDGFACVARAERRLNDLFTLDDWGRVHVKVGDRYPDWADAERAIVDVRRQVWRALVDRLEIRKIMSVAAWEALSKQIDGDEVPTIDHDTVRAMVEGFHARMPEMITEAVREVFRWLTPQRGDYKTNSRTEIGRRVVLRYVVEGDWSMWRVSYNHEQELTALENVFRALDGRGQSTRGAWSEISEIVKLIPTTEPCVGETRYFRFRGYHNRNLHIEFKRADLLAKLNAIAGGKTFKPAPAPEAA